MSEELEYKSTLKLTSFLFKETKRAAELIYKGFSDREIREMSKNENIFQVNTDARKSEIASTVLRRIKALDCFLIEKIADGNIDTSKQIVIYAIMKTDRLFFEFMYEVYREKILLGDFTLQDKDFNIFFERKKEQSERVASWNDYTFYKLKQVYMRILSEAGLIKNQKNGAGIIKPIVDEDISYHLKVLGDTKYLNALTGEM